MLNTVLRNIGEIDATNICGPTTVIRWILFASSQAPSTASWTLASLALLHPPATNEKPNRQTQSITFI